MSRLGAVITETIVDHYGRDEFRDGSPIPFGFNPSAPLWEWIGIRPELRLQWLAY